MITANAPRPPRPPTRTHTHTYAHGAVGDVVYRANKLQLLTGAAAHGSHVEVTTWFSRVSAKSYDISHEVHSGGQLLARVTNTRVLVLDGRAAPLPQLERLRQIVTPRETKLTVDVELPRPADGPAGRGALAARPVR